VVLAIALAAIATGCSKQEAEPTPVVTVQTAAAARASISQVITADAVLYPQSQAAIVPKISAPVERFYVTRGQHVQKGQILAVLEHQDLAAAALQNKGLYEQAQANYETTKQASMPADLQKARLDVTTSKEALDAQQKVYDDRQGLVKEGALPRRDLETAGVALAQAKSQYEEAEQHLKALQSVTSAQTLRAAEGQMESARGQYEAAQAQLGYATIRSPIDGWVTDRPFYAGEMATAGTPLLTVMDVSTLVARAPVPAQQAAMLHVGDTASLSVPGVDQPVAGKVSVVSPALDPSSTTVQIWITVSNPQRTLKPGVGVQASITARTIEDATVVPVTALLTDEEGARTVMVVGSDHKAHARPVDVGITQDGRAQITKGLKPGDAVVTTGAYGLADGTEVRVQQPQQGA
jgi:multidrug efflux pump subunit AcrA (membrane-fusion protein)